jgi:hypothetical protein
MKSACENQQLPRPSGRGLIEQRIPALAIMMAKALNGTAIYPCPKGQGNYCIFCLWLISNNTWRV